MARGDAPSSAVDSDWKRAFIELGDALDDPVFVWRPPNEMLWVNAAFVRETGKRLEDFGFDNKDNPFIHPDDLPKVQAALADFLASEATRSPPIENRFTDRWGRTRPIRSTVCKVRWGDAQALTFVCRVVENASAATSVDTSYRLLVDGASEGILKLEPDGRVLYANARFNALVGVAPVELAKRRFSELVHADDRATAEAALASLRKPGDDVAWEGRLERADGAVRWVRASATRLDAAAEGDALFVLVHDVTDARLHEEELRRAQKAESLGILAGGLVHDFNNILTSILANASFIQRSEHLAPVVAERLTDICVAAERAAELNRSLLAYLGRASKHLELLDLSALAHDTVRMLSPLLPKWIALRLSGAPESPRIFADPGQIGQVVLNLITNAVEAMGDRPGEVVVETSAVEISGAPASGRAVPGPPRPGSYVRLRVRDEGCGMTPDVLSRIFDPFFTTKATGRGLGLAAVVGIVRDHGGALVVDTAPRAGTTFDVLLPRAPRDAVAPRRPAAIARPVTSRGPILLVEDEAALRRVTKLILEEEGFQVELAEDGESAVAAFEASPARFAVVVLDHSMPRMRGDVAAAKMRAMRPDVPIVHVTGFRDEGQVIAGAVLLDKPYRAEQLIAAVREAIAARPR